MYVKRVIFRRAHTHTEKNHRKEVISLGVGFINSAQLRGEGAGITTGGTHS